MANEPKQQPLFDKGEWWEDHWKGMPEFKQENQAPYKTIYVHFEKPEDVEAFARLVGQRVMDSTKFIWYPEAEIGRYFNKRYVDAPLDLDDSIEILDAE
jgi:hypothetical protein